ncbi:hypothetical protein, partial [Salmonella sp. SAL4433]|uniref:hypothetical protein n=1 Tax=Salmonella sp. SAL4433 TaxID=3159888 RepID=UPI00397A0471
KGACTIFGIFSTHATLKLVLQAHPCHGFHSLSPLSRCLGYIFSWGCGESSAKGKNQWIDMQHPAADAI